MLILNIPNIEINKVSHGKPFWILKPIMKRKFKSNIKLDTIIQNKNSNNKSDLEKVVTKGWHNTPYPHSINCPVCEEMHEICEASDCWLPPWYKIRVIIGYWQSRAKVKFENLKYSIQKKKS